MYNDHISSTLEPYEGLPLHPKRRDQSHFYHTTSLIVEPFKAERTLLLAFPHPSERVRRQNGTAEEQRAIEVFGACEPGVLEIPRRMHPIRAIQVRERAPLLCFDIQYL